MDVGLYGKLPTHGDFLRRRVADDFVAGWDVWLQHCMAESRTALGEPWLETYLTSPVWRFALAPRVCGAAAVAGLLVPSVDRVGRYFPLTLVWPTPAEYSTLEVAVLWQRGFDRAERLVLDTLALDDFEFAEFDRRVMELADSLDFGADVVGAAALRLTRASAESARSGRPRCIPVRATTAIDMAALQLFGCQLDAAGVAPGLWWTDGSAAVAPSWLITEGLPAPASYSAMLDGGWTSAGWDVAATVPQFDPEATAVHIAPPLPSITFSSAGRTDRGPVRTTNQDALIDRSDLGLWAVADGMGGLSDGEVASRMVCDSVVDAPIVATLDEQLELIVAQLRLVNEYLRRSATRPHNPVSSGSTVALLLIRGNACAALWAGDSRIYRLRDGRVTQLTRDHSWAAQEGIDGSGDPGGSGDPESQAITRAVGAEDILTPEIVRGDVRPRDRFLLCSDGLCRTLDNAAIGEILLSGEPSACCATLIARAVSQGGTDNVTAVIVDCGVSGIVASSVPPAPSAETGAPTATAASVATTTVMRQPLP